MALKRGGYPVVIGGRFGTTVSLIGGRTNDTRTTIYNSGLCSISTEGLQSRMEIGTRRESRKGLCQCFNLSLEQIQNRFCFHRVFHRVSEKDNLLENHQLYAAENAVIYVVWN